MADFVAQWLDGKFLHIGNQDNFWEILERVGYRIPDSLVVSGSSAGVKCYRLERTKYEDKLRVWFYDNTSCILTRRPFGILHKEKENATEKSATV